MSRGSTSEQTLSENKRTLAARSDDVACVSVLEGYERWAHTYDQVPNPLLALEERYLNRILPDLAGKHALDLACGTGRWLTQLLARGAQTVVGLDLSAAMLRGARDKAPIRDRLVLADCLQLPFRASAFDFVLCSFAINHIHPLDVVAQELARTMRPGGQLLVCEMHPEAYARGWRPGFRDTQSAVQIETAGHSAESVISFVQSNTFSCLKVHDLFFGEPERSIFLHTGKGEIFADACRVPAVQVYQFVHTGAAIGS